MAIEYPEHAKLRVVSDESQAIGEFLEDSPYTLCELRYFDEFDEPRFVEVQKSTSRVLADYFGIDMDKLEAEKRQMLERMREANDG